MLTRSPRSGSPLNFLLFLCQASNLLSLMAFLYVFRACVSCANMSGLRPNLLALATFRESSLILYEMSSSDMFPISSCNGWKYMILLNYYTYCLPNWCISTVVPPSGDMNSKRNLPSPVVTMSDVPSLP